MRFVLANVIAFLFPFATLSQSLILVDSSPKRNATSVPVGVSIELDFNEALDPGSLLGGISVYSLSRGLIEGDIESTSMTATFSPTVPFLHAEEIIVYLLPTLKSISGQLLSQPLILRFTTETIASPSTPPAFLDEEIFRDGITYFQSLNASDLDGDNDIDILYGGGFIVGWFEKLDDGYANHVINSNVWSLTEAKAVDLDGDSDLDILTSSHYEGITAYLNDGEQNYSMLSLVFEIQPNSFDIADIDGNGFVDIVFSDFGSSGAQKTFVLYNQGGMEFTSIEIQNDDAVKVRFADIDSDGDLDIVQHDYWTLGILFNASGHFTRATIYEGTVEDFDINDIDGDGNLDIITVGDNTLCLHLNKNLNWQTSFHPTDSQPLGIVSGDFNGDSIIDFVLGRSGALDLWLGHESGLYESLPVQVRNNYFGINPTAIETIDLNNDGVLDFVSAITDRQLKSFTSVAFGIAYPFNKVDIPFQFLSDSDASWGDFDGDGDFDLAVIGIDQNKPRTIIYESVNGNFEPLSTDIPGLYAGSCDWGDFDKDGDLDLLLVGASHISTDFSLREPRVMLAINKTGYFEVQDLQVPEPLDIHNAKALWADFNNDGLLDICLSGYGFVGILGNTGNGSFEQKFELPSNTFKGSVNFGDYDADGDIDLALKFDATKLGIFQNEGDWYFKKVTEYDSRIGGSLDWVDFDNDGDLDLISSGYNGFETTYLTIYKNVDNLFNPVSSSTLLIPGYDPTSMVGDYNNDGFQDIILSSSYGVFLIESKGGQDFEQVNVELETTYSPMAKWVDYDQDGDLDIFTGKSLWRNNIETSNLKPSAPSLIKVDSVQNNAIFLSWDTGGDFETPSSGLSYQIYVGTQLNTQNVVNSEANLETGVRQKIKLGNVKGKSTSITNLKGGMYYFGVQSIDGSFTGSVFTAEQSVFVATIDGPRNVCSNSMQNYVAYPEGSYHWEVDGGQITEGQGTSTVTVKWNDEGAGQIRIFTISELINQLDIDIDKMPSGELSGSFFTCTEIQAYQILGTNIHSVKWALPDGVAYNKESETQLDIQWSLPGSYLLEAYLLPENNGCQIQVSEMVNVDVKPEVVVKGPNILCSDNESVFTTNAATPIWQVTNGEVSSKSNQSITVRWEAAGPGIIALEQPSDRGYCSSFLTIPLTVRQSPPKPELRLAGITTIISTESPTGYYEWFLDNNLVAQGQYTGVYATSPGEYHVRVYSSNGCFSDSAPILFDPEIQTSVAISPNPVSDKLTLQFSDTELSEVDILIYSSMGSLVRQVSSKKTDQVLVLEIEIPELPMGQYILIIDRAGKRTSSKFVKF